MPKRRRLDDLRLAAARNLDDIASDTNVAPEIRTRAAAMLLQHTVKKFPPAAPKKCEPADAEVAIDAETQEIFLAGLEALGARSAGDAPPSSKNPRNAAENTQSTAEQPPPQVAAAAAESSEETSSHEPGSATQYI